MCDIEARFVLGVSADTELIALEAAHAQLALLSGSSVGWRVNAEVIA